VTSPPLPADGIQELLKPERVAKWLGCSRAVVYSEAKAGRLPSVTIAGKLVRFERQAIEEYIAARRRAW
jgi:excisionase family DNA binding protein